MNRVSFCRAFSRRPSLPTWKCSSSKSRARSEASSIRTWVDTPLTAFRDGPNTTILCLFMAAAAIDVPRPAPDLCRCRQHVQGAGEVRFDPADGGFTAIVVHEQPVPDFQDEHQPDPLLAVDAARDMIAHEAAPRPGEPARQRNGEPHFAAVDGLPGDISLGEPLEHDLRAQPAHLQVLRQACGEFDELVVEEGHASLDAGSHAHAVALDQDV